jgi:hypothetical protein
MKKQRKDSMLEGINGYVAHQRDKSPAGFIIITALVASIISNIVSEGFRYVRERNGRYPKAQ